MSSVEKFPTFQTYCLILFCFVSLDTFVLVQCDLELNLAQIVFRHGDRSAVESYPNNPYDESMWPQGYGELTQIGMEQHYKLGAYFRNRYILGKPYTLLDEHYSRYQMYVRSTDYDRTLESAYCHLAGLYPPDGAQVWNKNITWQPIPVHTTPGDQDYLLKVDNNCPRYHELYDESLLSDVVKQEENNNKEFYEFVSEQTGVSRENISNIWKIFDTLLTESLHPELKFKLPAWANKSFNGKSVFDKMYQLESFQFTLKYNKTEMQRLRGGNLVGQTIKNFKARINETDGPQTIKYYMYSAHDTTVAAFLSALRVYNKIFPPYTATVILELFNDTNTGQYYVQILYKNDTAAQPYNLTIPGCAMLCPLDQFTDLMREIIPDDVASECQLTHPLKVLYIVIIAVVSSVLLLTVIALGVVLWKKKRRSHDFSRYSTLPVDS